MHVVKRSKHKKKNHASENRLLVYMLVIMCGVAAYTCVKWRKMALIDQGSFKDVSLLQRMNQLDKHLAELEIRSEAEKFLRPVMSSFGGNEKQSSAQKMLDSKLPCPKGQFLLPDMAQCRDVLDCSGIYSDDLFMGVYFETGKTKKLQRGSWKGHEVALQHPVMEKGRSRLLDFYDSAKNLLQFNSPYAIQLVGFCNVSKSASEYGRSYIVTEYYQHRSLDQFLESDIHVNSDAISRLRLAVSYLKVLLFLHTLPEGPHVMCDSYDLSSTLKQYVVTADYHVLLADLDDLPVVDKDRNLLTSCKHQDALAERTDVERSFIAPEQIRTILKYLPESPLAQSWSSNTSRKHQSVVLDIQGRLPPSIDEKVDIYKIPNITEAILLLKNKKGFDAHRTKCAEIWRALVKIHLLCKDRDPSKRPDTAEVLESYNNVIKEMS